jgi:hypothetical protein
MKLPQITNVHLQYIAFSAHFYTQHIAYRYNIATYYIQLTLVQQNVAISTLIHIHIGVGYLTIIYFGNLNNQLNLNFIKKFKNNFFYKYIFKLMK